LIQIKALTPKLMILGNVGAVHGHSLLTQKHLDKASRDHSLIGGAGVFFGPSSLCRRERT